MKNDKKHSTKTSASKSETDTNQKERKRQIIKKKEIPGIIVGSIFIIVMMYGAIISHKKYNSLKRNWKYTYGIIYDLSLGPRARWYIDYYYYINNIKYQGYGRWYPDSDNVSIGDTIVIVYDTTNVSYSRVARDAKW